MQMSHADLNFPKFRGITVSSFLGGMGREEPLMELAWI